MWLCKVFCDYKGYCAGTIVEQDNRRLRILNADAMALPEFLDNLALWEERFPDLHDYAGIRQRIEDARAGKPISGRARD